MFGKDVFEETIVEKTVPAQARVLLGMSVAFMIIFLIAGLLFHPIIWALSLVYLVVYIVLRRKTYNIEYEYEYTNGTLEIHKIRKKTKRTKLLVIENNDVMVMAPGGHEKVRAYKGRKMKTYDLSSMIEFDKRQATPEELKEMGEPEDKILNIEVKHLFYVLIFKKGKGEEQKLFFEPSKEMAEAMQQYNPSKVFLAEYKDASEVE